MKFGIRRIIIICSGFIVFNELAVAQNAPQFRPRKAGSYAKFSPLSYSLRPLRARPSAKRIKAFKDFKAKTSSRWKVRFNPRTALPESLAFGKTSSYTGSPEEIAEKFVKENKNLLSVDFSKLRLVLKRKALGVTHLMYEQFENDIKVEFSYVKLHIDENRQVIGYQSRFEPDIKVPSSPAVPRENAELKVATEVGGYARFESVLVYYPDEFEGKVKLAWKVKVRGGNKKGRWIYYVDAGTGEILFKYDTLMYACVSPFNKATGTVRGMVYEISPIPDGDFDAPYVPQVEKPFENQYIWIGDYSSHTIVNNGEYCSKADGKIFSTLKGPYFSVVNFMGPSAHYYNTTGQWNTASTPLSSPSPYESNREYNYSVSLSDTWSSQSKGFAMVIPRFTSFDVGCIDSCGDVSDNDEVYVKDSGGEIKGAYIGLRTSSFFGPLVENPSYNVFLKTDSIGVYSGFEIDISSYLVLSSTSGADNATGSILWSTSTTPNTTDDEVNVFYHLNKIHSFFANNLNKDKDGSPKVININEQLPVMVNVFSNKTVPGWCNDPNTMENAYYDFEHNNIMLGRGLLDGEGRYHSFALDGTVVRHEFVHYVVNKIYPIINFGEFGAISEAMADYFSLTSLKYEGVNTSVLGNFLGTGEGAKRDLSGSKIFPGEWVGEIHDDSLFLSQSLWDLRGGANALGNVGAESTGFAGMPRADVFTFAALFYFPDSFANFYDAFVTACRQIEPVACNSAMQNKINTAFSNHGIGGYSSGGDSYEPNNGAADATDVSVLTSVTANLYPFPDVDYYSLVLNKGYFTATLNLPEISSHKGYYYNYGLVLFDSNREYVSSVELTDWGSGGACPDGAVCTPTSRVTLAYDVTTAGRYYIVVAPLPPEEWRDGGESAAEYGLSLDFMPFGTADASIVSASVDNDEINFKVPCVSFNMQKHPVSSALSGAEYVFSYAQLLDHNRQPLEDARTDVAGGYLEEVPGTVYPDAGTGAGCPQDGFMTGRVKIKQGFSARYPAIGTVYLQIFGQNHFSEVERSTSTSTFGVNYSSYVCLGISKALHLTTNKNDLTIYNNKLLGTSCGNAILKYDLQTGGRLSVKVYTSNGNLVKTLFDSYVSGGKGTFEWDGTNSSGKKVSSGIYYIKTNGPGIDKVEKIAVIR